MSMKRWVAAVCLAAAIVPAGRVCGADKTFLGTVSSSSWDNPANWSPVGAPTSSDNVYAGGSVVGTIGSGGAQCASLNWGSAGQLMVLGGSVSVNGSTSVSGPAGDCIMLTNGARVTSTMTTLGEFAGSKGDVAVFGTGSKWTCNDKVLVGLNGKGTVKVADGGNLTAKTCNIDGQTTSSVTLESGGTMTTGELFMALFGSGTATVKIDGTGTRCDVVASSGGSGVATIGFGGNGRMEITGGGALSTFGASVGSSAGSTGTVTLSGAGSKWTSSSISVGQGGRGSIDVTANTTVEAGMELRICSSDDRVTVSGTLKADQITNNGTLSLQGLGKISTSYLFNNGTFEFTSGELHAGLVAGNLAVNGGKLCANEGTRSSVITGNLTMGGTVGIVIGGSAASGLFDRIIVQGNAGIGGALDVAVLDGYHLEYNQRYNIIDVVGTGSSRFAGLNQNGLVGTFGGVNLYIDYFGGSDGDVVLYTAPEPGTMALLGLGGILAARRRGAKVRNV
jgi:T5SS/PEP-CTERM-associated repeat protein